MQSLFTRYSLLTLLTAGLLMAGCDTAGPDDDGETTQVQGRVTDDQGYGSRVAQDEQAAEPSQISASTYGQNAANVEGAVVTASSVSANGSTESLSVSGQSTTQAEGEYDIDVAGATDVLLLTAEESSSNFTSKVLVYTEGQSQVQAIPMTVESEGESNVYVEAKDQDEDDGASVTVADVAAHVNEEVAADLESGNASASDVAASIRSSVEAEGAYYDESDDSEADQEEAEDNKQTAFLQLQSDLSAASSAQAQGAAVEAFEQAVANAYVNAGASVESQAKAKQTGSSAAVHYSSSVSLSSDARLGLRKKAELLAAIATARAVRAQFEENGASDAQLDALASARADLIASLRAAASADAVANAKSEYQAAVRTELENFLEVGSSALDAARTEIGVAAESALDAVLDLGIDLGGLASQFAQAYVSFYTDAEAAAQSSLETSQASNAAAGATVLVLLEGMATIG